MTGILLGCDYKQEWLLPWWWSHYSKYNSFPVAFFDFGLSEEGRAWCKNKGDLIDLSYEIIPTPRSLLNEKTIQLFELSCGKNIWDVRPSWLKKPCALSNAPFPINLWIDTDCEVKGSLLPLFKKLTKEAEIAIVKESTQVPVRLLPNEIDYNSGVILFHKNAKIIKQTAKLLTQYENTFAGDQNALSRAIYLYNPSFIELSKKYNTRFDEKQDTNVLIKHYCGGIGKIEILKNLPPDYFQGIGIPKKWQ